MLALMPMTQWALGPASLDLISREQWFALAPICPTKSLTVACVAPLVLLQTSILNPQGLTVARNVSQVEVVIMLLLLLARVALIPVARVLALS